MKKPDKQRYLNAVRHVEQREIPFVKLEVDFTIVREVLQREIPPVQSPPPPYCYYKFFLPTLSYKHHDRRGEIWQRNEGSTVGSSRARRSSC